MLRGMLTPDEIRDEIKDGSIDTVLVVFPDLQGRLMGKRVVGDYFVEEVLDGGALEACNYLLALDIDMTPMPGYRYANWEQGYGDFRLRPDLSTM
ncbi:MAG: glutamine synthetase, partial [Acidimicrobiia bacterium]|nr:glutamine synthetase [Acidimicrobiia bacterium]